MKYFEIIGSPGAGKSTIVANLRSSNIATLEGLQHRAIPKRIQMAIRLLPNPARARVLRTFGPQLTNAARFAAERPGLMQAFADLVDEIAEISSRHKVLRLALHDWARYDFMQKVAGPLEPVVADEGMCQRLASVLARDAHDAGDAIASYCNSLPTFSGVIWLHTPHNLSVARISSRLRRLKPPADLDISEWVSTLVDQVGVVVALLEDQGVDVFHVSGSGSIRDVTRAVVHVVHSRAS